MTAVAKKSPTPTFLATFDRWGRRNRCIACGERLKHPVNGRPRLVCPGRDCANAWKRVKRANRPVPRWTEADQEEAIRVWHHRCAYCDQISTGAIIVFDTAPVPVCIEHEALGPLVGTTDERCRRVQAWLSRCKPGCPLPDPWKGGGG